MALNDSDIPHVARLARLHVPDDNHAFMASQLNKVLAFVEQLGEVDTTGVTPMASVSSVTLPLRDDRVTDGGYADAVTANAPETTHNFFVVPKVVE